MSLERIDPECRPALEAFRAMAAGLNDLPLSERRAMTSALEQQISANAPVPSDVAVEDRRIPGPAGAPELAVRIYRPTGEAGVRPGVFYIHGGGMVVGGLETGHAECLRFCSELAAVVVSVDYRLAPENPHPAPGEDCYAALAWMVANAAELGFDPARVAIYGPSAGGGLTVATALRARDLGGPKVSYVMAIYPMLDPDNTTPSSHAITDIGIYDRADNVRGWAMYLGGAAPDAYAAPLRCADLSGFPPTYIDVGTEDLFRDEDIAFAERLLAAGVPVELHVDPGAFHGSELLAPDAALSRRQLGRRLAALRAALHPRPVLGAHALAPAFAAALGQPDALAGLLHPEASWSLPASLGVPVLVGREAIVGFRRDLYADVLDGDTVRVAVEGVLVDGPSVAIRTRMTATTRAGRPYDNDHAFFVILREGRIGDVRELLDPARAVAQLEPATDANEQGVIERISATHVKIVTSIEIDAPHDVVWAVLTDFAALPSWSSGLQGLEGDFRDGGQVTVTFRAFGRDQVFRHELAFFQDGVQFGWSDFATGVFTDRHVYRVEPLLNGRTRFVQSDEPQGAVVRFLGGMIARQTVSLYQTFNKELKARAEQVARAR
jgi:acetyl esterase/lipase/ketosteroid isomerase-like protein